MDEKQLISDIEAYVERVWPDVVADLAALVAIPSVVDYSQATDEDPYGPETHRALRRALAMAERLGLEPHDVDGHIGYADLPGASATQLATIAHVDVVPAGVGWTQDPFEMREHDGYLFGRGVLDDKGPAVLSAYMARFFIERGEQLPYTLRVIFGSDEECGMTDVAYYLERFEPPAFLFTPDANFPAGVGEKGHLGATFACPVQEGGALVAVEGGTVTNAIPGLAQAWVAIDPAKLPAAENIEVAPCTADDLPEGVPAPVGPLALVTAHGRGGHASLPEGTLNAVGVLVRYLLEAGVCAGREREALELLARIHASTDGSSLGIDATDDLFDPLTCIGGTIHKVGQRIEQTIDVRYPKSTSREQMEPRLQALADEFGAALEGVHDSVPFFIDPNHPAVDALIGAYNEFTGKNAGPVTMGGGTYARKFPCAVSFGPEEPTEPVPSFVGPMHGPDEGISIELLQRSLKIYIYSLARLMRLEF